MKTMYYEKFNLLECDANCKARISLALLSFFIISFSFFSCGSSSVRDDCFLLEPTSEEVSYNVGFQASNGIKYFIFDSKEYVGFANFRTYNKISLFDSSAKNVFSVNLDKASYETNCTFLGYDFISMDSIILLSNYSNKIFVIDTLGTVIYEKDYSSLKSLSVEMSVPVLLKDNHMRAGIHYQYDDALNPISIDEFYGRRLFSPKLLSDITFFNDDKTSLQMDSIYNRFSTKNQLTIEGNHILMTDIYNIFCTAYSDSIYIFDLQNNLLNVVSLKSKFSDKIRLTPITLEQNAKDNNLVNKNFFNNSYIYNVLWDEFRDVFYCFVRRPIVDGRFPFSIIILDDNFNVVSETDIDYTKYDLNSFVGEKGLYIKNINTDFGVYTFTLFKYE